MVFGSTVCSPMRCGSSLSPHGERRVHRLSSAPFWISSTRQPIPGGGRPPAANPWAAKNPRAATPTLDRVQFIAWLEQVRDIRNDMMHFDPDPLSEEGLRMAAKAPFVARVPPASAA